MAKLKFALFLSSDIYVAQSCNIDAVLIIFFVSRLLFSIETEVGEKMAHENLVRNQFKNFEHYNSKSNYFCTYDRNYRPKQSVFSSCEFTTNKRARVKFST